MKPSIVLGAEACLEAGKVAHCAEKVCKGAAYIWDTLAGMDIHLVF